MVIVMHQTKSTEAAFLYNERKVEEGHAKFYHVKNGGSAQAFVHDKKFRWRRFERLEVKNKLVKNKCFHVSVNPTQSDLERLTNADIRKEIDAFMKHMGYENQPYFVYKHHDVERTHFHIVSTRIDRRNSKKINDSHEKRKVSQFVKELELKYNLLYTLKKSDVVNLIPSHRSANLHTSIQEVFKLLNQSNIISRQEYLDILKAFNLEIYQTEKGQSVLIKDQDGTTLRHPIKMSDFQEIAMHELTLFNKPKQNPAVQEALKTKTENVLKQLIGNYRFFTAKELRIAFLRNNLVPYQLTKNGNINIYSPNDKTVVNAQYILKKYSVRLKDFALSNDEFYQIIRNYSEQLQVQNYNIADLLVDKEKSTLPGGFDRPSIVLNDLNLSQCETYNQVTLNLNSAARHEIQNAIKSHFAYLLSNTDLSKSSINRAQQVQSAELKLSYWERISRQFLFELAHYWHKEERKHRMKQRYRKPTKKKGKVMRF